MASTPASLRITNNTFSFTNVYSRISGSPDTLVRTLAPNEFYLQASSPNDVWVLQTQGLSSEEVYTIDTLTQFIDYNEYNVSSAATGPTVAVNFVNQCTFAIQIVAITTDGRINGISSGSPLCLAVGASASVNTQAQVVFRAYTQDTGQEVFLYVTNNNATQTCNIQSRSINSNQACSLTFINNFSENLDVFWLNYSGEEVSYGTIEQNGGTWGVGTYAGHPWVIRSSASNRLVYFAVGSRAVQDEVVYNFQPYEKNPLAMQALRDLQEANVAYFTLGADGQDCWRRWAEGTVNNVQFNSLGNFGYAANFVNNLASIGFAQDMEYFYAEDGYTLSCWVNVAAMPATGKQSILVSALSCNSGGNLVYAFPYTDEARGSALGYDIQSTNALSTVTWHNIVVAYNAGTQACKFYIDGVLDSSHVIPQDIAIKEILLPTFGTMGGPLVAESLYTNLNGMISDVSFYDVEADALHVSVLANNIISSEHHHFHAQAVWFLLIPICLSVVNIVAGQYLVEMDKKDGKTPHAPNYARNTQLTPYLPGTKVDHLDIWGQGRCETIDTPPVITGFKDSYNLEKQGSVVWNGLDTGRQIPNQISVTSWFDGFDNRINRIPNDGVKIMTSMGSMIDQTMANDMTKALDPNDGVIILYDFSATGAAALEAALYARKNSSGAAIFEQKLNQGEPIYVSDLRGKFNEIRMKDNTVRLYAPVSMSVDSVLNELKDDL